MAEQIPGTRDIVVGVNDVLTVTGERTVQVGRNASTRVQHSHRLSAGKRIVVEAGDELVLVCGKASITLKKDGSILIQGGDITLDGNGSINAKAGKDVRLKGQKVQQN